MPSTSTTYLFHVLSGLSFFFPPPPPISFMSYQAYLSSFHLHHLSLSCPIRPIFLLSTSTTYLFHVLSGLSFFFPPPPPISFMSYQASLSSFHLHHLSLSCPIRPIFLLSTSTTYHFHVLSGLSFFFPPPPPISFMSYQASLSSFNLHHLSLSCPIRPLFLLSTSTTYLFHVLSGLSFFLPPPPPISFMSYQASLSSFHLHHLSHHVLSGLPFFLPPPPPISFMSYQASLSSFHLQR